MAPRHRHRTIPTSSLVISYLVSQSQAAFVNDFSAYPVNARSCMNTAAAASGCAGNTVTEMNTCLCGNGGNFVMATAKCVEKEAKDELDDVYEMLLTSCTDSKTPLAVSQAQFLDPEEEDDDDKASSTSSINGVSSISNSAGGSSSTTFATSITTPPNVATSARAQASITSTSMTTYESVAPGGVTITVTRGIEVVPTGTVSSGQQGSNGDTSTSGDDDGPGRGVLAAGIAGGFAVVIGALAFLCYRRRKQRKERKGQVGAGGKGHESPPAQNATWNAHAVPAGGVPAPHPSHHPSNHTYAPVFELPGDETQAVEADSTPIGHAQPIRPPSRSIQSTPAHMSAHPAPAQPAAAHHGMPHRQIDDALQISQVELPPPRYSGPSSGSEWASEDKKFG
ncbi:hypothetical protein ColKHC_01628 [Colletotrichum higginsianum]|nr:hypothetical protein ColKHC_01628 [Colletotrichum higginsianum]